MPLVEKRYAQALINISKEEGMLDVYKEEFLEVLDTYEENHDVKLILNDPRIGIEKKKIIIKNILKAMGTRANLLNFILLLLDKNRLSFLPGIFDEYVRLSDEINHVINLKIESFDILSDDQLVRIKEKFKKIHNANFANVQVKIDSGLLGGVKVQIGDKIYDDTIKSKLNHLAKQVIK